MKFWGVLLPITVVLALALPDVSSVDSQSFDIVPQLPKPATSTPHVEQATLPGTRGSTEILPLPSKNKSAAPPFAPRPTPFLRQGAATPGVTRAIAQPAVIPAAPSLPQPTSDLTIIPLTKGAAPAVAANSSVPPPSASPARPLTPRPASNLAIIPLPPTSVPVVLQPNKAEPSTITPTGLSPLSSPPSVAKPDMISAPIVGPAFQGGQAPVSTTSATGAQAGRAIQEPLTPDQSRQRILEAFDAKQFVSVVDLAARTPSLLTCEETQILWRLAEAFVQTQRRERAEDVYRFILTKCSDPAARLTTIQKAVDLLDRSEFDPLIALGNVSGETDEFKVVRERVAGDAVAAAAVNPKISVSESDLQLLRDVVNANSSASDALLMGSYFFHHGDAESAEPWYRISNQRRASLESAEGLAFALVELNRPREAEEVLAPWQKVDERARMGYLTIISNLFDARPPPVLPPDVLNRMANAIVENRDVSLAQCFGWYGHAFAQDVVALRWFATALDWSPDNEPSAYGFAVAARSLGRTDALRDVVKAWGKKSPRIRATAEGSKEQALSVHQDTSERPPSTGQSLSLRSEYAPRSVAPSD